jgi:hypothetical protein
MEYGMNKVDFDSLQPGDFVYKPGETSRVLTLIGDHSETKMKLAVLGRRNVNELSKAELWKKLLSKPEKEIHQFAAENRLSIVFLLNHLDWAKDNRPTYYCLICGTTTLLPHECPSF